MSHLEPERDQLDRIARHSLYGTGANAEMIRYCFRLLKRHFVPGSLLELGPAEGVMTELIQTLTDDITLVDGSEQFCASLRQRFPSADVVHALFEEYEPRKLFDTVVLGHVLEHVTDPAAMLRQVRGWLRPGTGRVFAAVPNARSIHRQAAVIMGLLPREGKPACRSRSSAATGSSRCRFRRSRRTGRRRCWRRSCNSASATRTSRARSTS